MDTEIKRVMVTGAGGTVGDYVVDELLKGGYEVIAIDLPGKHLKKRHGKLGKNMIFVEGDLCDSEFVHRCVIEHSPDAIIHTAALIDLAAPREKLIRVNYEMVVDLYTALRFNAGKIFVHFSSCSIYDNAKVRTERTGFRADSPYEESKIMAEKYLNGSAKEHSAPYDPKIVILRPSLIYGPANKFLAANYLGIAIILGELFKESLPRFSGGPRTNMVHAEDVARAAVFLMENEATWKRGLANAFNIADDSNWGFGEQLTAIQAACGYKINSIPFPLPSAKIIRLFRGIYESPLFLKAFNRALKIIWNSIVKEYKLKRKFVPEIDKGMTGYFGNDTVFSNEKIKKAGFHLLHPNFRKGILSVIQWYRDRKWIP